MIICIFGHTGENSRIKVQNVVVDSTADYYVANQTHDPTFVRGFGLIDISAAMKTHNIPAVSTWGITIQILLLLITATVILRRSL